MNFSQIDIRKRLRFLLLAFAVIVMYICLAVERSDATPMYTWGYPLLIAVLGGYSILSIKDEPERYTYPEILKTTLCALPMYYLFACAIDAQGLMYPKALRFTLILGAVLVVSMFIGRYQYSRRLSREAELKAKIERHKEGY